MTAGIDTTRRYLRVTYRDPNGTLAKFVGLVWRDGTRIRGEARTDDPNVDGGIVLNVFLAAAGDVVKVEREDPRYGGWRKVGP